MKHMVSIGDCRVFVNEQGEGAPVLMVPDNIAGVAYMWRGVQTRLPHRRSLALDLPGIGRSEQPEGYDYSFTHLSEGIVRLMDELDIGQVDYVGHGRGGGIGQILAHRAPERVRSLTLISSVAYDYWPIIEMRAIGAMQEHLELMAPMLPVMQTMMVTLFAAMFRSATGCPGIMTNPLLEHYMAHWMTPSGMRTMVANCAAARTEELSTLDPKQISVPTLLLYGDSDNFFPAAWGEQLYVDIPSAEFQLLQGVGFLPPEEDPETVAIVIDRFLCKHFP